MFLIEKRYGQSTIKYRGICKLHTCLYTYMFAVYVIDMYTETCLIVPEFQVHDAQGSRIGICLYTYMWHIAYVCVI